MVATIADNETVYTWAQLSAMLVCNPNLSAFDISIMLLLLAQKLVHQQIRPKHEVNQQGY